MTLYEQPRRTYEQELLDEIMILRATVREYQSQIAGTELALAELRQQLFELADLAGPPACGAPKCEQCAPGTISALEIIMVGGDPIEPDGLRELYPGDDSFGPYGEVPF